MDGYFGEIVTRAIKYLIEGLAIAAAAVFIPRKALPLDEVASLALLAAAGAKGPSWEEAGAARRSAGMAVSASSGLT
jgi:hypothetical protein